MPSWFYRLTFRARVQSRNIIPDFRVNPQTHGVELTKFSYSSMRASSIVTAGHNLVTIRLTIATDARPNMLCCSMWSTSTLNRIIFLLGVCPQPSQPSQPSQPLPVYQSVLPDPPFAPTSSVRTTCPRSTYAFVTAFGVCFFAMCAPYCGLNAMPFMFYGWNHRNQLILNDFLKFAATTLWHVGVGFSGWFSVGSQFVLTRVHLATLPVVIRVPHSSFGTGNYNIT